VPPDPGAASSRHKSGSDEPDSAGPNRRLSPIPAALLAHLRLQRRINFRLVQNFFSYWLLCIFHFALTGRISS
jgi:hypothetical protein